MPISAERESHRTCHLLNSKNEGCTVSGLNRQAELAKIPKIPEAQKKLGYESESPTSSRIALPVVKAAVAIFLGSSMSFDLGPVAVNRLSLHRKMVDWKDSSDKHHRWFGNRAVSGCDPQGSLVLDWGELISVNMFRSEP
ncbi:hypothetical protein J6590_072918 [Homalodisca vitripennis]|nr:hypothetical protein J6590_072918 [Homalodisca vitripennis]